MRSINGDRLSGGAACKQAGKNTEVFRFGDDFFYPHAVDLYRGQMATHICIAFIGANHHTAGFRNGKVDPRDGSLGCQEFLTQVLTGGFRQVFGVGSAFFGMEFFVKQFAYFLLFQVDGRHDDMAGRFPLQLNDPFAKVGIHYFNAPFDQVVIQVALLGEHGFALHQMLHLMPFQNAVYNAVVFLSVGRPMNLNAILDCPGFKLFEILIEF